MCRYRPFIFQLPLSIARTQQPNQSLGIGLCVCTFPCIHCSLCIVGCIHLGETGSSSCLLSQVHVLMPTVGRAVVNCVACCGRTSSQWHQIGRATEAYNFVQAGSALSIECGSPCRTSSFPPGQKCLQVQEGTSSPAPIFQYRPLQYGILRHGCRCSLIAPSCSID